MANEPIIQTSPLEGDTAIPITKKIPPLVELIRSHFEEAKTAKLPIEDRLIKCYYAFQSKYTPQELMDIRELGGSEIYVPITNMKVRAGKAWLVDIFFQPNELLFDLKPTPIPDLPDNMEAEVMKELQNELAPLYDSLAKILSISNGQFDASVVLDVIKKREKEMRKKYLDRLYEESLKKCEVEKKRIHDQFVEGNFYEAFSKVLLDIMIYPSAFMKGVILRKQKRFITSSRKAVDVIAPSYNRVSPFDIYPAPHATGFNDGYIIEILHLTPQELYSLIGVTGYNEEAIKEALAIYSKGHREQPIGKSERDIIYQSETVSASGNYIDVIEYWGTVESKLLNEYGIQTEDEYVNICAWLVGNIPIKVMLNPDPLGMKPYVKASFIELPDSFWGIALPEVLEPIQKAVNALARASINNAVVSSGPIIERNRDRAVTSTNKLAPFMIFDVTESAINSAPAYRFYQLTPISQQTLFLLQHFQRLADEYSGIPAYAHGDVTVGGAGRALANYEKLITDRGFVPIGEIKTGDRVMGIDGAFHTVKAVYPQGERKLYRITFSDGRTADCDEEHRWAVSTHPAGSLQVLTTKEILSCGLKRRQNGRKSTGVRNKWYLPKTSILQFSSRPVKIDPYTLGLLLGNGSSRCVLSVHESDKEIFDYIPYRLGKPEYRHGCIHRTVLGIKKFYKEYGLGKKKAPDKFIPDDYLFNSVDVRISLLQGLMDIDGCATSEGKVFFSSNSIRLIEGVAFLVRSLGGQVYSIITCKGSKKRKKFPYGNYDTKDSYKIYFTLPDFIPFRLSKKRRRVKYIPAKHISIEKIEPIGTGEATCITVDAEDGLFLLANGIPTHNTASGLTALMTNASRGIKDVIKNIDDGIIVPLVKMQYYFNLYSFITSTEGIPDLSIEARGSINFLEKQAQASKLLQFLQITTNPQDIQIIGLEGRRFLLQSIAESIGINLPPLNESPQQFPIQALSMLTQQQLQVPEKQVPEGITEQAQELRKESGDFLGGQ